MAGQHVDGGAKGRSSSRRWPGKRQLFGLLSRRLAILVLVLSVVPSHPGSFAQARQVPTPGHAASTTSQVSISRAALSDSVPTPLPAVLAAVSQGAAGNAI